MNDSPSSRPLAVDDPGVSDVGLLAQAVDALPAYVSFVDAELRYRWVSKPYEQWYGLPRGQIVGRKLRELMSAEQFQRVEPYARQALAGQPVHYEVEVPAPGGGARIFEVSYVPSGAGQGFHVLAVDRTEERRAERALRESEARFRALVEGVPDLIFLMSEDGVFLDCHAAHDGELAVPRERFLGRKVTDVFEAELAGRFLGLFAEACATQRTVQTEYPLEIGGEERRFECRIVPCGAHRVLGIVRDVTERARRDAALRQVAEGVSAATGTEFFRSVVIHLAGVLKADYVLVGTVEGEARDRARTLAVFGNGAPADNFEYALQGTPCEGVLRQTMCAFASGAQRRFPEDTMLAQMGAEAYVGTPLLDSAGRALGLMAAVWTRPLDSTDFAESLLRIFAVRAAAELERLRAEEGLRLAARVFETAAEGIMVMDPAERILSVNRAFCEITGYGREDVVGRYAGMLRSRLHGESYFQDIARTLAECGQWQGEMWNRRQDGSPLPCWVSVSAVRDQTGRLVNMVCILNDISSLKESQQRLEQLANYDSLTGLPNRNLLQDRVRHGMDKARRDRQRLALLYLDLDNFKAVNDTLGHDAGDRLLVQVGARLRRCVRDQDTVARFGGDEFVVVLDAVTEPQQAARMADRVAEHFREPFAIDGREQAVSFSLGIALYPDDGADLAALLRGADLALYRAKEYGRNCYRFFTEDLNIQAFERQLMEASLRRALERGEFALHYQPVVEIAGGQIVGLEALLHWQHPDMGLLPPSRFLPVAEDSGLVVAIGAWAVNAACRQAAAWGADGHPRLRVVVNISPRQLQDRGLVPMVQEALAASGARPTQIELDLPEGALMSDPAESVATLRELRRLGVRLSIDDFGTGRSSLTLLRRLPVDALKIDRSLVRDLSTNPDAASIVTAAIGLARSFNLEVTGEGVETAAQRDALVAGGCQYAQGYFYSRALAAPHVAKLLAQGRLGPP